MMSRRLGFCLISIYAIGDMMYYLLAMGGRASSFLTKNIPMSFFLI
jgi:hypothetical protein